MYDQFHIMYVLSYFKRRALTKPLQKKLIVNIESGNTRMFEYTLEQPSTVIVKTDRVKIFTSL